MDRETILVVEDDAIQNDILCTALRNAGYEVLSALDADQARAQLSNEPDVCFMVLDLALPGVSGMALARQLSQLRPHLPFLVLTAHDTPHLIEEAIAAGALSYLLKPVDTRQLVPALRAAIARYRDLEQLRSTSDQLQEALNTNRDVSVAIGLTMCEKKISQRSAFELLRSQSRNSREPLRNIARRIVQDFPYADR